MMKLNMCTHKNNYCNMSLVLKVCVCFFVCLLAQYENCNVHFYSLNLPVISLKIATQTIRRIAIYI